MQDNKKYLLDVQHLTKVFKIGSLLSRKKMTAVDDVSFNIESDKPVILSIVGESGCGKSTLCKMILRLLDIDSGNVVLDGHNYVEKANAPEIWRKKFITHTIGIVCVILGILVAIFGAFGMFHEDIIANRNDVKYGEVHSLVMKYKDKAYSDPLEYVAPVLEDYLPSEEEAAEDTEEASEETTEEAAPAVDVEALGYMSEPVNESKGIFNPLFLLEGKFDQFGLQGEAENYLREEIVKDLEFNMEYEEGMEKDIEISRSKANFIAFMMKIGLTTLFCGIGIFVIGIILIVISNIKSYPFKQFRLDVQPIFQNPFEAFSTRKSVDKYLFNTALRLHIAKNRAEATKLVDDALHSVGLSLEVVKGKYSNQFSGGELQRVSIARALITKPKIIIADEPVAMIDASMKMNIVNLFKELRDNYGISFIYITHDLSTAYYVSDYIATLYRGCLIEYGTSRDIMENPAHPYTKLLMDSVPRVGDKWDQDVAMPDMEDKEYAVTHCKFAARCPYATQECLNGRPEFTQLGGERKVLCFHPLVNE